MKDKPPYAVPDLSDLFDKTFKEDFAPVQEESGWRVIINDTWVCKTAISGTPKRVYASQNAAKERAEGEFSSRFYSAFRDVNKAAYDACYHYISRPDFYDRKRSTKVLECKDPDTVDALDKASTREFRKWMNKLYEAGAVRFVQVK